MRKITKEAIDCFYLRKPFKKSNTEVKVNDEKVFLYLFDNKIAEMNRYNNVSVSLCGHNTATTRERLNGLRNIHVKKIKDVTLLNGERWNGKLTTIKTI